MSRGQDICDDVDVLVVGGGAAGLAAAIESARAGARTLVVEAATVLGGAAAVSGGGVLAVATDLQRALGVEDSVGLASSDWLRWGGAEVDRDWMKRYVRDSNRDVIEWTRALGVDWWRLIPQEGNSVPRWHEPRGGGQELVDRLAAEADRVGARWLLNRRVQRLDRNDRRFVVEVLGDDGALESIPAGSVIVATGGFTADAALVNRYGPHTGAGGRVLLGGARTATGDGLRLVSEAGGQLVGLDRVWTYPYGTPDDLDPTGTRGMAVRGVPSEIWLNSAGHRFHNENLRGGRTGTQALMRQERSMCWAIFDSIDAETVTLADPRYMHGDQRDAATTSRFLERSPFVGRGNTFAELAADAGLPVGAAVQSLEAYNTYFSQSKPFDIGFGRDLRGLRPLTDPPFFAVQYFPMARKSLGGVRTDLACRVLDANGTQIPHLFAAGEVAGMAGGQINGTAALEGTMIGPSLLAGRVAGRAAAVR